MVNHRQRTEKKNNCRASLTKALQVASNMFLGAVKSECYDSNEADLGDQVGEDGSQRLPCFSISCHHGHIKNGMRC